jgi:hypothetical protein
MTDLSDMITIILPHWVTSHLSSILYTFLPCSLLVSSPHFLDSLSYTCLPRWALSGQSPTCQHLPHHSPAWVFCLYCRYLLAWLATPSRLLGPFLGWGWVHCTESYITSLLIICNSAELEEADEEQRRVAKTTAGQPGGEGRGGRVNSLGVGGNILSFL